MQNKSKLKKKAFISKLIFIKWYNLAEKNSLKKDIENQPDCKN